MPDKKQRVVAVFPCFNKALEYPWGRIFNATLPLQHQFLEYNNS